MKEEIKRYVRFPTNETGRICERLHQAGKLLWFCRANSVVLGAYKVVFKSGHKAFVISKDSKTLSAVEV